jgi:dethiobiotin synthetase
VVAAAITAALRSRGVDAIGLKPILTGLDEPPDPVWPRDHELLARVSGRRPEEVNTVAFGPAVSPHLAAEVSGRAIEPGAIVRAVLQNAERHQATIVEGVGGLLVPLAPGYTVRDLARAVSFPLVIVARPGLGTINHTLLTLQAARAGRLEVAGVVLTPWPPAPEPLQRSNRATIERLGGVEVFTMPLVPVPDPVHLARAGSELPLERWFPEPGLD